MADILDEVLNDEKDEKRLKLFSRLLPIIIVVTIIIGFIISMYTWYNNRKVSHNKEIGDLFLQLVSKEYSSEELIETALEDIINTSGNNQAELASIKIVSNKLKNNDAKSALLTLETIISNKNYYELTTAFARILWVNIILDKLEFSEGEQVKIHEYFQYFKNEQQPFYLYSLLLKALFFKKLSNDNIAKENAEAILKNPRASEILKEQARAILAIININ